MRPLALGAATVVVFAAVPRGEVQAPPPVPSQQTFRASTDVVHVDVSVRDGGRIVTGLTPADFVLTDNGVRQSIESVEVTAVPIDLTLVLDVSGNPRQPVTPRVPREGLIAEINEEVGEITGLLRSEDRVRLFAIDRDVQQVWSLREVSAQAPVARLELDGLASLYDTLAAALLRPVEPARRHIVIAATKGMDSISSIGAGAIETIASQSDALFHVVLMETAFDNEMALSGFQCAFMGYCSPTRRFWVPSSRRLMGGRPVHPLLPDGLAIAAAAEATGGALHKTTVSGVPSLAGTFRRVFEDFRSGYLLRYTPQGVRRDGWHEIEVRVPARGSYRVRARRGYGVEELAPPPVPVPVPEVPRTMDDLTLAYDRGAFQSVVAGLRAAGDPSRLMRDFQAAGNPWPATPKREAAFALEVAEGGIFSPRQATRQEAYNLVERFSRLIRHPYEPDVFERYWHFAALTLIEGTIRPDVAETFVTRALARIPDEPRFLLSRAIVLDQRWRARGATGPAVDAAGEPTAEHIEAVRSAYEAAITRPDVTVEARIRFAWFLHRLGRHDEALEQLAGAGAQPIADPSLRYLRALFLGHTLVALDRLVEGVEAYRAALEVVPAAQSARVALMNALLLHDDRRAAEGLAEAVQSEKGEGLDPWWIYWLGQYRFYPAVMARLREMSR